MRYSSQQQLIFVRSCGYLALKMLLHPEPLFKLKCQNYRKLYPSEDSPMMGKPLEDHLTSNSGRTSFVSALIEKKSQQMVQIKIKVNGE